LLEKRRVIVEEIYSMVQKKAKIKKLELVEYFKEHGCSRESMKGD